MRRLMVSVCLTLALIGLVRAADPDDNSPRGPYYPFNISYKDKLVSFKTNTQYEVYSINGKLLIKGYGNSISLKNLSPASVYIVKAYGYSQKIILTK